MRLVLPIIIVSQLCCTSLWFAGNVAAPLLGADLHTGPNFAAHMASAVQLGFITGTLSFAVLMISDRFSPSKVFLVSAIIAGLFNLAMAFTMNGTVMLCFRFFTGFFLAGIYPVGMKIASDHYQKGLGRSLGFLVGALVLGTSLPHLLKSTTTELPWKFLIYYTSALAAIGGFLMFAFVPDGPYRKPSRRLDFGAFIRIFSIKGVRSAAFGYFGHMWELYTFWVFVPVMLRAYQAQHPSVALNILLLSFLVIAGGAVSCGLAGWLTQRFQPRSLAAASLALSGLCCVLSPWLLYHPSPGVFLFFLFSWGLAVIADSPMFSTLVARYAPEELRGTALTITNCIGFAITIISIELISMASESLAGYTYLLLAPGPVLGVYILLKSSKK